MSAPPRGLKLNSFGISRFDGPWHEIAPGAKFPERSTWWPFTETPDERAPEIELDMRVIDGRVVCERFEIKARDGHPLTPSVIRSLPSFSQLRDDAAAHIMKAAAYLSDEDRASLARAAVSPRRAREPIPMNDDDLRSVAELYRLAVNAGKRNPTQLIADERHVSRMTASRWIRRARELGYLGAAKARHAGEF